MKKYEISIILPCRNEEKAIQFCVKQTKNIIKKYKLNAELIVSDSSEDNSPLLAKKAGAKVVKHNKEGYGNAYKEGFKKAIGKYIIMLDADGTYDFNDIPLIIHYLKNKNYDFVIGNRFEKPMQKGAMPWHHKYIGNPILSLLVRIFFKSKVMDSHCGIRGIKRIKLNQLKLKTKGMEFASEMVIKAAKNHLKTKQFPTKYKRRIGTTKLNSINDGIRHLKHIFKELFKKVK